MKHPTAWRCSSREGVVLAVVLALAWVAPLLRVHTATVAVGQRLTESGRNDLEWASGAGPAR